MSYKISDFSHIANTKYGLGFHWTTWNVDKDGNNLPFEEAVNNFDVEAFANQAQELGAGHVLLTSCHQLQHLPCPHPVIDEIMPNRTCKRDLIMEIADALLARDIKFMLYYHHGTDGELQDPEWWKATNAEDYDTFYNNYFRILTYLGEKYKDKISAYWFDAGYGLTRRGDVPWEKMTEVAKAGYPNRPICYNSGILNFEKYTDFQDYWAGEMSVFDFLPEGDMTPSDLYWYAFIACHIHPEWEGCGEWGIHSENYKTVYEEPDHVAMAECVKAYNAHGGAVTFNMLCYQDGSIYAPDYNAMMKVKKLIRG